VNHQKDQSEDEPESRERQQESLGEVAGDAEELRQWRTPVDSASFFAASGFGAGAFADGDLFSGGGVFSGGGDGAGDLSCCGAAAGRKFCELTDSSFAAAGDGLASAFAERNN
jgi:hypothetical protein